MKLTLETPTFLRIEDISSDDFDKLSKLLAYTDSSVEYQLKLMKKNVYMRNRFGDQWVDQKILEMQQEAKKSLLMLDKVGYWTYPGMLPKIKSIFDCQVEDKVVRPEFGMIPWENKPQYELYPYQQKALEKILKEPHCNISAATGTGKSFILLNLIKKIGLPTVLVTPSRGIAEQLYDEALQYFGKKRVGRLWTNKNELGKHIIIAVAKSLTSIDDKEKMDSLKKYQVLAFDESHRCPANDFERVVHFALAHCPYRYFVSGTQVRSDGRDLMLEAIIGKEVFNYPIQNAIADGFLAKLNFMVFDITSESKYNQDNVVKMNQEHLYRNKKIAAAIADIASSAYTNNKQLLILIDEIEQEKLLKNHLKIPYTFAHGNTDVNDICQDFNEGKIKCVIGTSAVSTGVNFKSNEITINWQGNKAETKILQAAVGRSTRLDKRTGKTECTVIDFRLINVPKLKRHADTRINYYTEIGDVKFFNL